MFFVLPSPSQYSTLLSISYRHNSEFFTVYSVFLDSFLTFFLVSLISQFPSHIISFFHHATHLLVVDFWKFLFSFAFFFLSSHVCKNPVEFGLLRRWIWIYHHSLTTSEAINMSQRNRLAPSSSGPCDVPTFGLLARNKAVLALSNLFPLGISLVFFCVQMNCFLHHYHCSIPGGSFLLVCMLLQEHKN